MAWHGRQKNSSSGNKIKEYPKWKIGPYGAHSLSSTYNGTYKEKETYSFAS